MGGENRAVGAIESVVAFAATMEKKGPRSRVAASIDKRIAALAGRQRGYVKRRQLLALGLGERRSTTASASAA